MLADEPSAPGRLTVQCSGEDVGHTRITDASKDLHCVP
jgi:hypothetical protein